MLKNATLKLLALALAGAQALFLWSFWDSMYKGMCEEAFQPGCHGKYEVILWELAVVFIPTIALLLWYVIQGKLGATASTTLKFLLFLFILLLVMEVEMTFGYGQGFLWPAFEEQAKFLNHLLTGRTETNLADAF